MIIDVSSIKEFTISESDYPYHFNLSIWDKDDNSIVIKDLSLDKLLDLHKEVEKIVGRFPD